ncbi:MAG: hotdog fold thioesterase [Pseudomonadota bacterium]
MIWFGGQCPSLDAINRLEDETLASHLGIRFTAIDDDSLTASMPVRRSNCQPYGILHGGASAVLIETLGSVGAALTIDLSTKRPVGLEINANHLRSVASGHVHGTARALHRGRRTQVWDVDIRDDDARLCCSGRLTIALID